MSDLSTLSNISGTVAGTLSPKADQVIRQAGSAATENAKIEKSAKDFESILLGSWLQQAEESFGSLPGGDDDEDTGKEQYQGIAMQQLGSSMTAAGGIGIAKMIAKQLHKAEDARVAAAATAHPASTH
ncbi:MAG: rod-binding protein [Terracidiphilus sp.]|jgi:Rod binding domain-containing protein